MDFLISKQQQLGINSTKDPSTYYLQFFAITTWLISKGQLGDLEQQQAYVRAFQTPLLTVIMNCHQLKKPNHHPNVPHKVEEVYKAICFVLQGYSWFMQNLIAASSSQSAPQSQSYSSPSPAECTNVTVKTDDLGALFAGLTKLIIDVINNNQSWGTTRQNHMHNGKIECNYFREEHFIHNCPHVMADIQAGKCQINQNGAVVLPAGVFILRDIARKFPHDHVNKWHKRYSNQLAVALLIHTMDKHIVEEQKPVTQPIYQLTTTDCITVLEVKWFNTCARKQVPAHANCTCAQKDRNVNIKIEDEEVVAATRAQPSARIEEVTDKKDAQFYQKTPTRDNPPLLTVTQPSNIPEHLFWLAKDATYSPPTIKNVGLQDKQVPPINQKPELAYRTYLWSMIHSLQKLSSSNWWKPQSQSPNGSYCHCLQKSDCKSEMAPLWGICLTKTFWPHMLYYNKRQMRKQRSHFLLQFSHVLYLLPSISWA